MFRSLGPSTPARESVLINAYYRTNQDDGPILGRTITTDTQTGNLVVALLAILSTLGMTR
jgi:hypothetical protein